MTVTERVGGPAGLVYGPIQLDPAARRPLYMSRPSSIRQPDCKRMRHEQPCMFDPDLLTQGRNYAQRLSELECLAPRITFRTAINSLRVPNHILLTLFDDFLVTVYVLCRCSTGRFTVPVLWRASFYLAVKTRIGAICFGI